MFLALATETIQSWLGRDAELEDVGHDGLGAGCAAALWIFWHLRTIASIRIKSLYLLTAATCVVIWSWPLMTCAVAYWHRVANFPVLAQFDHPGDLYFTEIRGSPATLADKAASSAAGGFIAGALEISLQGDPWPGVALIEPIPDWRSFRALMVEVSNPGSQVIRVQVRVDDNSGAGVGNSFTGEFLCEPQRRCVQSINLQTLASRQGPQLDLQRIARVIVFHRGPAPNR